MKEIFPIIFGILFCSVFVWFFLCHRLFKILETRHPATYEAMGKPSLIMNNSISNNISFMKFLFGGQWRDLEDDRLTKLSKSMLVFFFVYLAGFAFLFVATAVGFAP